jgi:hypothetical protein
MLPFWRLEPPFRFAIYIAFAVLFARARPGSLPTS